MKLKPTALTSFLILISFIPSIAFNQIKQNPIENKDSTTNDLDNFFSNIIIEKNFVALGAIIVKENDVVWQGYYGFADLEEKLPLTEENIFHLASLSKVVTATALMLLYDKGKFALDDDINNYIPIKIINPNFPDIPITFRMLLTHTSGLADVTSSGLKIPEGVDYPHGSSGDSEISLNEMIEELFTPGGRFYSTEYFSNDKPGSKYNYSNFGFALIGYLVEKISGKDFSTYCKENIFTPLGMINTSWFVRDLDTNKIIYEYGFSKVKNGIEYKRRKLFGEPGYPSGNLRTTMSDFINFIMVFLNDGKYDDKRLLNSQTLELILSAQGVKNIPSRSFPVTDIGLCWLMTEVEGKQFYTMNGFSGSIFANAYFSTKDKIAIIYFFTGISMQNMHSMIDITKKLVNASEK